MRKVRNFLYNNWKQTLLVVGVFCLGVYFYFISNDTTKGILLGIFFTILGSWLITYIEKSIEKKRLLRKRMKVLYALFLEINENYRLLEEKMSNPNTLFLGFYTDTIEKFRELYFDLFDTDLFMIDTILNDYFRIVDFFKRKVETNGNTTSYKSYNNIKDYRSSILMAEVIILYGLKNKNLLLSTNSTEIINKTEYLLKIQKSKDIEWGNKEFSSMAKEIVEKFNKECTKQVLNNNK